MTVTDPTTATQAPSPRNLGLREPVARILTLVRRPGVEPALETALDALRRAGARVAETITLDPGSAVDVPFTHTDPAVAETAVRDALADVDADLAVQSPEGRRKKVLVADMESTVIANEMLDELADFVGCREEVAGITARAMNGELDFRAALEKRVALLEGLGVEVLERTLERLEIDPGAATLVATMRAHGATAALVSGGFDFYAERVARRLGFDVHEANELEIVDGRLTGRVVEPIRDRDTKLRILERLCAERGLDADAACTVGDGANDLAMLRAAGLGVAYRAKPAVRREARYRVEHGDLRTLLDFQGYRREEWVG